MRDPVPPHPNGDFGSAADVAQGLDLREFPQCIEQASDFGTVSNRVNTVKPIREAYVKSMEVIQSRSQHGTYHIVVLDLDTEKDRVALDQALGTKFPRVPDSPDFSTRIRRRHTEETGRGVSWKQTVEFVRNPLLRKGSQSRALMYGTFPKLRLYHVLDLVRIVHEEFDRVHGARTEIPRGEQFNDEDFVLAIACLLHGFSNDWTWSKEDDDFSNCHRDLLDKLMITHHFMHRWARTPPSSPLSLEDFLKSGTVNSKFRLRSRPKEGGPLLFCEEPHDSFRRRLAAIPDASPKNLPRYTLNEFSTHILRSNDPPEAYATIEEVKRFRVKQGLNHQYVVLRAVHSNPIHNFWLRLDRSGGQWNQGYPSSSVLPPDDRVTIASSEEALCWEAKSINVSSRRYEPESKPFNVRELAKVLDIFRSQSKHYILVTENCWYFSSVVEEIIHMSSGAPVNRSAWAWRISSQKTKQMKKTFDSVHSVSSGDEEAPEQNAIVFETGDPSSASQEDTDDSMSRSNPSRRSSISRNSQQMNKSWFSLRGRSKPSSMIINTDALVRREPGDMEDEWASPVEDLEGASSEASHHHVHIQESQAHGHDHAGPSKFEKLKKKMTWKGAKRGQTIDSGATVTPGLERQELFSEDSESSDPQHSK